MVKTDAGALPEGKVKIRLEQDGTTLEVDEDDVEKVSKRPPPAPPPMSADVRRPHVRVRPLRPTRRPTTAARTWPRCST